MRAWYRPEWWERWLIPLPPTPLCDAPEIKDKPPRGIRRGRKRKEVPRWRLYCVHPDGRVHEDPFAQCSEGVKVRATSKGMAKRLAGGEVRRRR